MSNLFQLSKYVEEPKKDNPEETETKKVTRTISITEVGKQGLSGTIAKALIEALRSEDLELVRTEIKPRNEIFKNIKFVSTESINSSDNVITGIEEGDIVLTDNVMPNTNSEAMFEYNVRDLGDRPIRSVEKLASRIASEFEEEIRKESDDDVNPLKKAPVQLMELVDNLKLGDEIILSGKRYQVTFMNDTLCQLTDTEDEGNATSYYIGEE